MAALSLEVDHSFVVRDQGAPGWLGYIGDEILPSYFGTILIH